MPGPSPHVLIWSEAHQHYELSTNGLTGQYFRWGDEPAWQAWLAEHTAFAFIGQAGRLSVLKEARSRGTGYWYAYRTRARHTHKHYLGPSTKVTFARLEQVAKALESRSSSGQSVATGREGSRTNAKSHPEGEIALFSPKLSRPRLSTSLVERTRLLSQLDAVRSHPLTLVSASAGSGKTTLLSAWATRSSQQVGRETKGGVEGIGAEPMLTWLSLDSLDNDPIRFWASVIATLRTRLPSHGQRALVMLHSSESPPLSTILMTLLLDFVEEDADIILILDDYHVISDQAICDSMRFLIEHLPANLHLVLATRTDPELPLSRWRVRSHLLEIRDRDLRFTQEEAASFLTRGMGLPLSEGEVATLHQRTEGWIAGLQLAALSLRNRGDLPAFVKNFTGSHRFLLDYVQQEVLAQLPERLQDFLLQTSILPRMNAALCQAVTASPTLQASQDMLEALERANLFVVPLDDERQWYRFHDLFREALRARLQASRPELVPLLHLRAASFYERSSLWWEAIAHALAAPDYAYAASLMEQAAPHFWLSGEVQAVQNWMQALPDAVLQQHARLALDGALRLLESLQATVSTSYNAMQTQVEQTMARVEAGLQRQGGVSARQEAEKTLPVLPEEEVEVLRRRLRLLRALIASRAVLMRGDADRLRLLVDEIEDLSEDEEVRWKMIWLSLTFWLIESLQREGALLIKRLLEAKQQISEAGDPLETIRVVHLLAFAYGRAGRLRLAHQECLEGLALVKRTGVSTIFEGNLQYHLAVVYYAWNQLAEATDSLHHVLHIAHAWQQAELLVSGNLLLAQIKLARGDLAAADQVLHQAEALIQQEGLATYIHWVAATRVKYWLAAGDLAQAATWAEQEVFSPEAWDPNLKFVVLMQIQVSLSQKHYSQTIEMLQRWSRHLDRPGDIDATLDFLALQVVALHQGGKREQAAHVADRLLALTEPEGNIRLYLDAGLPMKSALKMLLEAPPDDDPGAEAVASSRLYVSRLLAAFKQEELRLASVQDVTPAIRHNNLRQQTPIELLSPQEQRVLRLLVTGQTYAEMAEMLVVSPNTIKTQISSIYRKLGVSRRAEAIARTSHLHLL
jgi:LuxR family transcriptional regulator, maltose regulon positive regulatory protein